MSRDKVAEYNKCVWLRDLGNPTFISHLYVGKMLSCHVAGKEGCKMGVSNGGVKWVYGRELFAWPTSMSPVLRRFSHMV